jgi:hypothetical protein
MNVAGVMPVRHHAGTPVMQQHGRKNTSCQWRRKPLARNVAAPQQRWSFVAQDWAQRSENIP